MGRPAFQPSTQGIVTFPKDPERPADETRNREPRCWKCSVDKKKCTIEIDATAQSACQRCRRLNKECSNEGPPTPRKKLNKEKCSQCRRRKQRCDFKNGEWPAKCSQCAEHKRECSRPKETDLREARKRSKNIHPRASAGSTQNIPAEEIQVHHLQSSGLAQTSYGLGSIAATEEDAFMRWIEQEVLDLATGHDEAMCGGSEDMPDALRVSADPNLERYIDYDNTI